MTRAKERKLVDVPPRTPVTKFFDADTALIISTDYTDFTIVCVKCRDHCKVRREARKGVLRAVTARAYMSEWIARMRALSCLSAK